MNVQIRAGDPTSPFLKEDKEVIKLCKHLSVFGKKSEETFPSVEYVEKVYLRCEICDKRKKPLHILDVCVN